MNCSRNVSVVSDSATVSNVPDMSMISGPGARLLPVTDTPTNGAEAQAIFTSSGEDLVPHIAGGVVGAVFGIIAIICSIKYWNRGSTTILRKKTNYGTSSSSVVSGGTGLLDGKPSLDGSVGSRSVGSTSMESRERPFGATTGKTSLARSASLMVYKENPPNAQPLVDMAAGGHGAAGGLPMPPGAQGKGYDPMQRRFRIVRGHRPRNQDELLLLVGEVVTVEKAFQDQWCLGNNF